MESEELELKKGYPELITFVSSFFLIGMTVDLMPTKITAFGLFVIMINVIYSGLKSIQARQREELKAGNVNETCTE